MMINSNVGFPTPTLELTEAREPTIMYLKTPKKYEGIICSNIIPFFKRCSLWLLFFDIAVLFSWWRQLHFYTI